MSIEGVAREVLVRYLDTWAPVALHSTRGATFAMIFSGGRPDPEAVAAALGVFGEFGDRMRGRRLTVLIVAAELAGPVPDQKGLPAGMTVHAVEGVEKLPAALKAAGAAGAPLLSYVDGPDPGPVTAGKPSEMLLLTGTKGWTGREGFSLTAEVDLVAGGAERLLGFATNSAKSLEAFKNELWAV